MSEPHGGDKEVIDAEILLADQLDRHRPTRIELRMRCSPCQNERGATGNGRRQQGILTLAGVLLPQVSRQSAPPRS